MLDEQKLCYLAYDITATTLVYGKLGDMIQGTRGCQTSGSSTTVSATVSGVGTFSSLRQGDFVWFVLNQALVRRTVGAAPTPDSITVSSAIDLSSGCAAWWFRQFDVGTAANDGAHNVAGYNHETLCVKADINSVGGATDNIIFSIEARAREDVDAWDVIKTVTYAVAGGATSITIPVRDSDQNAVLCSALRVGIRADTSAGGGVTDIDVAILGERATRAA